MSRTTGLQRADRILRLLIALRDDAICGPLVAAGFTDADLAEGWSLLRALSPGTVAHVVPSRPSPIPQALDAAEQWARRYIRVLEPAIARKHPKLRAFLFDDLDARGPAIVGDILKFLGRVKNLPEQPGGRAARALLEQRGLDKEAIAAVRAHIATIKGKEIDWNAKLPETRDYSAAEQRAWAWYLDWSGVARATITDGRVLRRLGFAPRGRRPLAAEDDAEQR